MIRIVGPYDMLPNNLFGRPSLDGVETNSFGISILGGYDSILGGYHFLFYEPATAMRIYCSTLEEAKSKLDKALVDNGFVLIDDKEEFDKYRLLI